MYINGIHLKFIPPVETSVVYAEIRKVQFDDREVLIIIDDFTRPVTSIARMVVDYAISKVGEDKVAVVVASGLHRSNTHHEVAEKIGSDLAKRIRIYYHSPLCNFPLNRTTHNIIAVGCVIPHTFAGLSGDAKIILPGLRYFVDIMVFHKSDRKKASDLVCSFKNNIDTFVNYTVNSSGDPVRICTYTSDSDDGYFRCDAWNDYTVNLPDIADVAILAPYIKNLDFQQSMNAVQVCKDHKIVKPGGTICIRSDTPEGIGVHYGFQQPNGVKPAFYDEVFSFVFDDVNIAFICPNIPAIAIQEYFKKKIFYFESTERFSHFVEERYGEFARVNAYYGSDIMIGGFE